MVQTKTQGNHRVYPKELALYVEHILLEETDAGLGRGLSAWAATWQPWKDLNIT